MDHLHIIMERAAIVFNEICENNARHRIQLNAIFFIVFASNEMRWEKKHTQCNTFSRNIDASLPPTYNFRPIRVPVLRLHHTICRQMAKRCININHIMCRSRSQHRKQYMLDAIGRSIEINSAQSVIKIEETTRCHRYDCYKCIKYGPC